VATRPRSGAPPPAAWNALLACGVAAWARRSAVGLQPGARSDGLTDGVSAGLARPPDRASPTGRIGWAWPMAHRARQGAQRRLEAWRPPRVIRRRHPRTFTDSLMRPLPTWAGSRSESARLNSTTWSLGVEGDGPRLRWPPMSSATTVRQRLVVGRPGSSARACTSRSASRSDSRGAAPHLDHVRPARRHEAEALGRQRHIGGTKPPNCNSDRWPKLSTISTAASSLPRKPTRIDWNGRPCRLRAWPAPSPARPWPGCAAS
jgi:hypothetical protein